MMVVERTAIGFDRRIDIEWLDAALGRVAANDSVVETREFLWDLLHGVVAGDTVHSARGKTLTVLMRIWVTVPASAEPLRAVAIRRTYSASSEERLAIHWAMCLACYPFFADVAAHVGKLIALNGRAGLSQVIRRMTEDWGDRSTLPRAIQRVLRSMVQWGTLREGERKGVFMPAERRIVLSHEMAEFSVQAILISHGRGMILTHATSHPALFPFEARWDASRARASAELQILRQGDQMDYVDLASR